MQTEYIYLTSIAAIRAARLGEVARSYIAAGNARAAYWYAMLAAHQAGFCLEED